MRRAVAVKEIRINPEEGLPFTAIREGKRYCHQVLSLLLVKYSFCLLLRSLHPTYYHTLKSEIVEYCRKIKYEMIQLPIL